MMLATLLLASTAAVAGSDGALNPRDSTILAPEAGKDLLHQCSRAVPTGARVAWRPKEEQIAILETMLPAALHVVTSTFRMPYRSTTEFRRQYVGIARANRKLIYMNAFPRDVGNPAPDGPPSGRAFDWRRQPVVVCDGGPAFFGVEYDPATKRFNHFEFNGSP